MCVQSECCLLLCRSFLLFKLTLLYSTLIFGYLLVRLVHPRLSFLSKYYLKFLVARWKLTMLKPIGRGYLLPCNLNMTHWSAGGSIPSHYPRDEMSWWTQPGPQNQEALLSRRRSSEFFSGIDGQSGEKLFRGHCKLFFSFVQSEFLWKCCFL